jgi:hypothetical protein
MRVPGWQSSHVVDCDVIRAVQPRPITDVRSSSPHCRSQEVFEERGRRTAPRSTTQSGAQHGRNPEPGRPMCEAVALRLVPPRRPVVHHSRDGWRLCKKGERGAVEDCVRGCSTTMMMQGVRLRPNSCHAEDVLDAVHLAFASLPDVATTSHGGVIGSRTGRNERDCRLAVHQRLSWLAGPSRLSQLIMTLTPNRLSCVSFLNLKVRVKERPPK